MSDSPPSNPKKEHITKGFGHAPPSVCAQVTFDRIRKTGKHAGDALLLYCFYTDLALKRGNGVVWATVDFCSDEKGLGLPAPRIRRARKTLLHLELIENVRVCDADGKVTKWLVRVNYVHRNHYTEDAPPYRKSHRVGKAIGWEKPQGGDSVPNINLYLEENINLDKKRKSKDNFVPATSGDDACGENANQDSPPEQPQQIPLPDKLAEWRPLVKRLVRIVQSTKNINITGRQQTSWAKEFARLHRDAGVSRDRMHDVLAWYRTHAGEPYIPVVESGTSFREKFSKLEAAIQRASAPATKPKTPSGYNCPTDPEDLAYYAEYAKRNTTVIDNRIWRKK